MPQFKFSSLAVDVFKECDEGYIQRFVEVSGEVEISASRAEYVPSVVSVLVPDGNGISDSELEQIKDALCEAARNQENAEARASAAKHVSNAMPFVAELA